MWCSSSWAGMWCMAAAILFTTATTTINNDCQPNALHSIFQTDIMQWSLPSSISPPHQWLCQHANMPHHQSMMELHRQKRRKWTTRCPKKNNARKVSISLTPHCCPPTIYQEIISHAGPAGCRGSSGWHACLSPVVHLFFSLIFYFYWQRNTKNLFTELNTYLMRVGSV